MLLFIFSLITIVAFILYKIFKYILLTYYDCCYIIYHTLYNTNSYNKIIQHSRLTKVWYIAWRDMT